MRPGRDTQSPLRSTCHSPLVTIGSHTVSHPWLTTCDDEALAFEDEGVEV